MFFSLSLFAENPHVYSALGDLIYNNVPAIEALTKLPTFSIYKEKIQDYTKKVAKTKKDGFAVELGYKNADSKRYLNALRELSKVNDFFVREVNLQFKDALKQENTTLFVALVGNPLLDTQKYKQDIIKYYFTHKDSIQPTGIIQKYLEEDAALKARQEAQRKRYKSKRQRELERIRYLREKDKEAQEKLEKELDEKLKRKKQEIREYQEKELSKTI